jgi:hypothetical protein
MASGLTDYTKGYQRADFWQERKEEYAKVAKAFRAEAGAPSDDDYPAPDDSDLPF